MRTETWKDIDGFRGHYKVSNKGRIKSLKYGKESIRKLTEDSYGYLIVVLTKPNTRKHYKVHRLVANAFIENPDNKKTINHKDCNKKNNNVANLEWMSFSENSKHGYKNGAMPGYGEQHYKSKLTENDVLDILCANELLDIDAGDIAEAYNVSKSNIYQILRGDTWKHIQF